MKNRNEMRNIKINYINQKMKFYFSKIKNRNKKFY